MEGTTEAEAIVKVKAALELLLAGGKVITIEVNPAEQTDELAIPMKYAGIFAGDPTFGDWMDKLATIRREANTAEAE
ncbi:MAG: hypothetical protein JO235_04860 [Chroococcidiopsidaceae cyanobacterium CP_BM_RX_35]|nr:hypothetical protein [Chroococcidiopsidaceae cyanobacterium CP_BM_RX_35]